MAYSKITWNSGDVITAEKLNNIEEAVEDVSLSVDDMASSIAKIDNIENTVESLNSEIASARNYNSSGTANTLGGRIDELVRISNTQPGGNNEIWVNSGNGVVETEVPTMEEFNKLKNSNAPEYSNNAIYAVGEYVFHNGNLYRCQTAITTAEIWTAAHWTQVVFGEEIANANAAVSVIINSNAKLNNWQVGMYYPSTSSVSNVKYDKPQTESQIDSQYVTCNAGDVFYLTGVGLSGGKLWIWTKSNGDIISRANSSVTATNLELIAPDNAAYLLVNCKHSAPYALYRDVRSTLKTDIIFNTAYDMASSTNLQSNMIVKCLGYNNPNDGLGCYYHIVNGDPKWTGRTHIDNSNLYAIPYLNISTDNNKPGGNITEIVRIAQTYQQSGNQWFGMSGLSHDEYPTAFDDNFVPGTYNMSCSTLSRLILYGIDYQSSKYGGGNNDHRQGYWPDITTKFKYTSLTVQSAADQALWCAYKGYAYYPNNDYTNIRPGDLVFFGGTDPNVHSSVFMQIDHVAIFIGAIKTSSGTKVYQFISANGSESDRNITTFFYYGSEQYFRRIVLAAGFEKLPSKNVPENIAVDSYVHRSAADGTQGIYTYDLVKPLESYTGYTIVIKSEDIHSLTFAVNADVANHPLTYDCIHSASPNNWDGDIFVAQLYTNDLSNLTDDQRKKIRVYKNAQGSMTITEFKIYDGLI